jgi:acyl-CoA synthetase (AMP-forming)/AMP-acid ligase II
LADRVDEEEMEGIDLSSMRMFVNCSEVVRSESHKKFFNRFQKYGVKKESLAACYAMAETTFAVTQTEPGFEARMLTVDRNALARKIVQPPQYAGLEKICVSSGKPISDCLLKIIDENGVELPENRVGKVFIKSISLFDGYRNKPETTSQVLKDGWYSSGDIGFLHNGEYFIIGRGDDVIIVAGKNIFPEDIEDVVNNVKGVIPGRIVAFGVENLETGTEDVAVIAETSCEDAIEKNPLELTIKQAGMDIDVTISVVYLVPPRWLIKSSSGKPSRKANKERILVNNVDLIKK